MQAHKKMALSLVAAALITSGADARPKVSDPKVSDPKASSGAAKTEQTCGQELAASAEVPQKWQELMNHVATNMEGHATWVGTDSGAAKAEHDALLRVAGEYRAMAAAAGRAATAMKAMKDLPPTAHDPARFDRPGQVRFMRAKIEMQREFARLLTRHAEDSEKALAEMEGR